MRRTKLFLYVFVGLRTGRTSNKPYNFVVIGHRLWVLVYIHSVAPRKYVQNNLFSRVQIRLLSRGRSSMRMAIEKPDKRLHLWISRIV